mmetsp:Transcript_72944/g.152280  ORF Transcript_72944/g.152280 Transcript_72944/m.152280 type:complete len:661 (-) Transcript_72944:334-2316(-)
MRPPQLPTGALLQQRKGSSDEEGSEGASPTRSVRFTSEANSDVSPSGRDPPKPRSLGSTSKARSAAIGMMKRVSSRTLLTQKETQSVRDIFRKPRKFAALCIFVVLLARAFWLYRMERWLVDELMQAFDIGQDQRLSTNEMVFMLRESGVNITKDQLHDIFGSVDNEGDGYDEDETASILYMMAPLAKASSRLKDMTHRYRSSWIDIILTIGIGGGLVYIVAQSDTLEKKFAASSFRNAVQFKKMQSKCNRLDEDLLKLNSERSRLEKSIADIQNSTALTVEARDKELKRAQARLEQINGEQLKAKSKLETEVHKWQSEAERCMREANRAKGKVEAVMTCMKGIDSINAFANAGKGNFSKDGAQPGFCSSRGFSLDKITFGTIDNNELCMFETSRRDKIGEGKDCAFRAVDLSNDRELALKMYNINSKEQRASIQNDLSAHRTKVGDHPHIVSYERVIESETTIFVLMELLAGQDLFDVIATRGLLEHQARLLFRQLTEAVRHLHSMNILHCDIKPENAMVVGDISSGEAKLKLIDFGCSCFAEHSQDFEYRIVHDMYMPPEHGENRKLPPAKTTDMWRLGCTLFVMLTRRPPYSNDQDTRAGIAFRKDMRFYRDKIYTDLSSEARDLLESLLLGDPAKRPTAEEVLKHPWVMSEDQSSP